jgi:CHASE2 domain-containing sensor protein
MSAEEGEGGFWKEWRRHLFALVVIAILIQGFEKTAFFAPFESLGIDQIARAFPVPPSKDIFLVEITDEDYKKYFGNMSPLNGDTLSRLLRRIAADGPRVIGVDLDTSETKLPEVSNDERIIWAEVPDTVQGGAVESRKERPQFLLAPVAGNIVDIRRMGMPQFPQDEDGIVRRFEDSYYVLHGVNKEKIDSMPCAVMARFNGVKCESPGEERLFSLSGDRFHFQTLDANSILSRESDAPLNNSPFHSKIVLVGGRYRAGRDNYITPAGELAGLEVIANAAQSYTPDGRAVRESPWWLSIPFDLLTGTLIIWVYYWRREKPIVAFWLSILLGPVIAFALNVITFTLMQRLIGFVPLVIGIAAELAHDYAERLQHARAGEEETAGTTVWETISYQSQRLLRYPPRGRS